MGWIPGVDNGTTIMLLIIPMILAAVVQANLSKEYSKYLRLPNSSGLSGAEAARYILDKNGLQHVTIGIGKGTLSDYFDPRKGHINLSPDVYNGRSVSSVSVAAHEVGHAIQHQQNYAFIALRNTILPLATFASSASWGVIFIGFISGLTNLLWFGIILLAVILLFQVFTLPLEFDASKRALANLEDDRIIDSGQIAPARKVLKAAAMTYVVAVIASILEILRLVIIANDRD